MIERTYNIPLRREFQKVPKYKRAKKSIKAIKEFLSRHLKQEDFKKIKLGSNLNLKIWEHGIKNPPHHVKVNAIKTDDGTVYAELFGYEIKLPEKKESKKEKKKEEKTEAIEDKVSEKVEEKTGKENKGKDGKEQKEEQKYEEKVEGVENKNNFEGKIKKTKKEVSKDKDSKKENRIRF